VGLPLPLLLALYALCYAPFSAMTKVVGQPIGALPASLLGSCLAWGIYLVLCGDAGRRPRFDAQAIAAGVGGAAILCASTVAYGLGGSLVLPLLLMKGGAVLLGVGVDRARRRPIDPRSACVATLAILAVVVAYGAKLRADSTAFAVACAAVYLLGYGFKLPANDLGKGDPVPFLVAEITVTEVTASALVLAALPWVPGAVEAVRDPVVLAGGVASVGCGALGGLVILSPGGHTLLVSLSRCVTVLAGAAATVALGRPIAPAEAVGAAIMCVALAIGGRVRPRAAAR
jgi:hypothetical protein